LPPDQSPQLELTKKINTLSLSDTYETDIITLFHAAGDFNYRSRWQEGVSKVEEINHYLPRIGMRSKFTLNNGQSMVYASSYSYRPEKIEFSETDEKKNSTLYFILEKISPVQTKLTLKFYVKKNGLAPLLFNLTEKKKLKTSFERSLVNLHQLLKEIPSFAYDV
jgi:hypothetical protein